MTSKRSYPVEVVGESHANPDGTPRQSIISRISVGEDIRLVPEPDNPHDPKAVAVHHRAGQIGYISRERRWIWERIDRGQQLSARVHAINARRGAPIGVVLLVTVPVKVPGSLRVTESRQAETPTANGLISQLLSWLTR